MSFINNNESVTESSGQNIVIKLGGSILKSQAVLNQLVSQIASLVEQKHNVVIVHGAGPQINEFLKTQGMVPKFCNGLRITDAMSFMAVYAALGQINATVVNALKDAGLPAIGLHAEPGLFNCVKKTDVTHKGASVDLGWVGEIKSTNVDSLNKCGGSVAVVTPIGWDEHRNKYNINADHAALAIAAALKAERLVFVSDVAGVLADKEDPSSVIPYLGKAEIESLIDCGTVSEGMIPKLMSSLASVEAGVKSVSIVSGCDDSALAKLVQGHSNVGTTIGSALHCVEVPHDAIVAPEIALKATA